MSSKKNGGKRKSKKEVAESERSAKKSKSQKPEPILADFTASVLQRKQHQYSSLGHVFEGCAAMGQVAEQLIAKGEDTTLHHVLFTLLHAHAITSNKSSALEDDADPEAAADGDAEGHGNKQKRKDKKDKKAEKEKRAQTEAADLERLVEKMLKGKDLGKLKCEGSPIVAPKKTQGDKGRRKQLEEFLQALLAACINESHFGLLERLMDVLVGYSVDQRRSLRLLATHALTQMLSEFGVLCLHKRTYVQELRQRSRRDAEDKIKDAEAQEKWLLTAMETLSKRVMQKRNSDVMPEARVLVAETLQKLLNSECLQLIMDKRVAKTIGQFVFDKNKAVKKLSLAVVDNIFARARNPLKSDRHNGSQLAEALGDHLTDMFDSRHVSKIIQMGYLEVPPVAVQAIKALSAMHAQGLLDEYAIDFVCKLTLRKSPLVAREAALFLVECAGEGKILGLEYRLQDDKTVFDYRPREARQSVDTMSMLVQGILGEVSAGRQKKALETALDSLEKVTVSVYDLRAICDLLMSGEKDQATESKLPERRLDLLAELLHAAFKRTRTLGEEEDKGEGGSFKRHVAAESDSVVLSRMPQLLSVHKHSKRVVALIKTACLIAVESIKNSETHLKQTLKILKRVCHIFVSSVDEDTITIACKLFYYYSKLSYIDDSFHLKVRQHYEKYLSDVALLLAPPAAQLQNEKHIQLFKLPIILGYIDIDQVALTQERLLTPIVQALTASSSSSPEPMSDSKPPPSSEAASEGAAKVAEESKVAGPLHIENMQLLITSLFYLHANAFAYLYAHAIDPQDKYNVEKYEVLRQNLVHTLTVNIKKEENVMEFRTRCFTLLANVLCSVSSDAIRSRYNALHYDLSNEVLGVLNDYFLTFVRGTFENSDEISLPSGDKSDSYSTKVLEVNQAVQTLILTCEKVFHSELAVWYLAIFGSNKRNSVLNQLLGVYLQRLQEKCFVYNGRSMYYMYVKEALAACYSFLFHYPESHTKEMAKKMLDQHEDLNPAQHYALLRTKDLAALVLESSRIHTLVSAESSDANKAKEMEMEKEKEAQVQEEEAKISLELFHNFVIDLLKESLRSARNFALLDVVQLCITPERYTREKMGWLYQLFEALSQHVLKVDSSIDEAHKSRLADFKAALFKKATAVRVKRGRDGRASKKTHATRLHKNSTDKKEEKKTLTDGSSSEPKLADAPIKVTEVVENKTSEQKSTTEYAQNDKENNNDHDMPNANVHTNQANADQEMSNVAESTHEAPKDTTAIPASLPASVPNGSDNTDGKAPRTKERASSPEQADEETNEEATGTAVGKSSSDPKSDLHTETETEPKKQNNPEQQVAESENRQEMAVSEPEESKEKPDLLRQAEPEEELEADSKSERKVSPASSRSLRSDVTTKKKLELTADDMPT